MKIWWQCFRTKMVWCLQKLHYPHELRKMEDVPELESVQKLDAQN